MLGLIFAILLSVFLVKAVWLAVRMAWGLLKVIFFIVLFPFMLIALMSAGLAILALPLAAVAGLTVLLVKA